MKVVRVFFFLGPVLLLLALLRDFLGLEVVVVVFEVPSVFFFVWSWSEIGAAGGGRKSWPSGRARDRKLSFFPREMLGTVKFWF